MKLCRKCNTEKSLDEFSRRGSIHQAWCKLCIKAYDKLHYQKVKPLRITQNRELRRKLSEYVRSTKDGKPCTDCDTVYPAECLDYHHVDSKTKLSCVSELIRLGSKEKIDKEIAKCRLVCANCHRIITRRDNWM